MARVSWRGDIRRMNYRLENLPEDMLDMAEEVIAEVTSEGAAEMRQIIRTSDTKTGLSEGRRGRVKTGQMLDDVEVARPKRFRRSVRGEFGWGVAGGNMEDYYAYQENGFTLNSRVSGYESRADVPPMHALLTAFMHTREKYFARMRQEMRSRR